MADVGKYRREVSSFGGWGWEDRRINGGFGKVNIENVVYWPWRVVDGNRKWNV